MLKHIIINYMFEIYLTNLQYKTYLATSNYGNLSMQLILN